jgi:hypothetical protein
MRRRIAMIVGLTISVLIALAVSTWTQISFWGALGIALAALVINGFVAEIEDRRPGGFYNPAKDRHDDDRSR